MKTLLLIGYLDCIFHILLVSNNWGLLYFSVSKRVIIRKPFFFSPSATCCSASYLYSSIFSPFQCLLPLCFAMLYSSVLRWPSTSQLQCFAAFQPLSLCPGPSRVTPIISWARSTGATSACMRQGLCVVAWYSPFSWLGNNPHYNSLSHTHTHVNIYTVWHTHTHI